MEDQNSTNNTVVLNCPKCKATMEQGCLVERRTAAGEWNINLPNELSWATNITKSFWNYATHNEKPIISYRCVKCGYLENYSN